MFVSLLENKLHAAGFNEPYFIFRKDSWHHADEEEKDKNKKKWLKKSLVGLERCQAAQIQTHLLILGLWQVLEKNDAALSGIWLRAGFAS